MKVLSLVLGCLLLSLSLRTASCVPLPEFFPFGPSFGDTELDQGDAITATVDVQQAIPYLGLDRDQIIVRLYMHAWYRMMGHVHNGCVYTACTKHVSVCSVHNCYEDTLLVFK